MTRTLLLLRHAKPDKSSGREDFDRFLTAEGQEQAHAIGRQLAARELVPEVIVSSPAERARETATIVCEEMDLPRVRIHWDRRLYYDNSVDLTPVIEDLHPDNRRVLIVGHNPGLERLLQQLTAPREPVGLGTACTAVVQTEADWGTVLSGQGSLVEIVRPDADAS